MKFVGKQAWQFMAGRAVGAGREGQACIHGGHGPQGTQDRQQEGASVEMQKVSYFGPALNRQPMVPRGGLVERCDDFHRSREQVSEKRLVSMSLVKGIEACGVLKRRC